MGISSVVLLVGISIGAATPERPLASKLPATSMSPKREILYGRRGAATPRAAATANSNWTVYHNNVGRSGAAPAGLRLSSLRRAWTSPTLDGNLYGEPLVWQKRVYDRSEMVTCWQSPMITCTPSSSDDRNSLEPEEWRVKESSAEV